MAEFVRDMENVAAALETAQSARYALDTAMRDLELALAGEDLDGIDDLDITMYDVEGIVAWADDEDGNEEASNG